MTSIMGANGKGTVEPALIKKQTETLNWLWSCIVWKDEVRSLQKLLHQYSQCILTTDDKKMVDHFQNLFLYYGGEVINNLAKKLRDHEVRLSKMLESDDKTDIQYYKEHDTIIDELDTFSNQFKLFRSEVIEFVEK